MRRVALVLLLLGTLAPGAEASRSTHVRKAYGELLAGVAPRSGVVHRSLVVVALVARKAPTPSGLLVDPAPLTWTPSVGKQAEREVVISWRADAQAEADAKPVVLPSGTVLVRGNRERVLGQPALIDRGAPCTLAATALGAQLAEDSDAPREIRPAAPPEYANTLLVARDPEALRELLTLESVAVGQDPEAPPTLAGLTKDGVIKARADIAARMVDTLGKAYGGETVGHVAFLGTGVVQFVLCGSPDTYRSWLAHTSHGLGLAETVWEWIYDLQGEPRKGAIWDDYVHGTTLLLEHLVAASFKPERREGEPGGELWRVRSRKAAKRGRPSDVGWLLLAPDGAPLLYEAWPDGAPLPPPVGRASVTATDPDDTADDAGAMTWYFVKRFHERFPWRRVPEWVRRNPRPPLNDGRGDGLGVPGAR